MLRKNNVRHIGSLGRFLVISFVLASWLTGQTAPAASGAQPVSPDYSGMYTFLQEGEFVQLTVEDHGLVTGFVSRYSDEDGDHKTFVDHFFKQGKLDGKILTFITEVAQNCSYEFKGTIERGEGKKPEDEAYYVLTGTLIQSKSNNDKKTTLKEQSVAFKSFPQDAEVEEPKSVDPKPVDSKPVQPK